VVPYALSGYTWGNPNVSVSFMPDGTLISSSYPSNLFATYNAVYPQATWQHEVARALQVWADVSNLNFHFVADDGSPQGTAGLAQGDPRFGDIRIGGYNMGSGILGLGWNPGSTTTAGDVELSTANAFLIGSMPDLASVVMHEVGHGIGFNHSLVDPAVMEGGLWGTYPGPYADDIAGVQAMYGARKPDVYDAAASNNTLGTATPLTLSYGAISLQADISSMTDVDYYKVVAPSGTNGTLTVSVDARNLSLFDPKVSVFDSFGNLLATASAAIYGDVATVNLTGLAAGQTYYVEASGATTDVFGMGAYKLSAQFGGFTAPTIGPDQFEPNNTAASAANFGTVTSVSRIGLTLHTSTDVDYYTAVAGNKATYTVTVNPTQGSGMLSLAVLNAQQTVLASSQSQTGAVTLSVSLAAGQQYYVKVYSPSGGLFVYNLSIAKAGASGGGGAAGHKLVPGGDFFRADGKEDEGPDPAVSDAGQAPPGPPSEGDRLPDSPVGAAAFVPSWHGGVAPLAPAAYPDGAIARRVLASFLDGWGPPLAPAEHGGAFSGDEGAEPSAWPSPTPASTSGPVDREAKVGGVVVDGQPAATVEPGGAGQGTDSGELEVQPGAPAAQDSASVTDAAAAALIVFAGGLWGLQGAETKPRKREGIER
jgi:hypothetical protein